MTIPGQQTINIGQPNDSANSDSLYTAFNIIQNNFTELFTTAGQVQSLVAGNGIAISNSNPSTFVVTNTGVTSLIAGENVTITTLGGSPSSNGTLVINSTGTGNGGGAVNSVGVTSNTLSVTNSPIISSGNINVNLPNISPSVSGSYSSANIVVDQYGRVISASNGAGSGTVTSIAVTGGTGLSVSGSPITTSGTIEIINTGVTSIVAGSGVSINQSNGAVTISATGGGGNGGGTVTRVGVTSNNLTITGSPITTSGNITVDLPSNLSVSSLNVTTPNSNTGITISTSSNDSNLFGIAMKKSRGSNVSPAAVQTNDTMLNIQSSGYTSYNKYQSGGGLNIIANGSASSGSSYIPTISTLSSTGNDNIKYNLILDDSGNLSVSGKITNHVYSNTDIVGTMQTARARGTDSGNVINVQIGDSISRYTQYGYTGNGLSTTDGIAGWSFAGQFGYVVDALPSSSGAWLPSTFRLSTISTSNTVNLFYFYNNGNLSVPNSISAVGNVTSSNANLGNLVTANYYSGTLTTASQPNITSVGTLSSVSVTNNITAGNVYANSGTIGASLLTGTLTTASQPNITSVGTLSSVSVTNNVTAGNVYANSGTVGASLLTGTLTTNAQPNITSVGTLSSVSVTDNVTAGNVYANSGTIGASLLTGTLTTASQPNITSVGTLSSVSVTNNIISGNVYANSGTIRGNTLTSVGNVNGANAALGNLVTANYFTGALTTNAQPNITSVGTLISIAVTGNANIGGLETTTAATPNTTATITATIPIVVNGVAYKIMLTSV